MTCSLAPTSSVSLYPLRVCINRPPDFRCAGHLLLTQLLLPTLFAATDASPSREKARIVTVSSCAHYGTKGLDFDAIADGPKRKRYNSGELYNKSKFVRRTESLPNVLFADPDRIRRVTSLWRASLRGGMVTRLCPRVYTQESFARIFDSTCLVWRKLYSCVPSSRVVRDRIADCSWSAQDWVAYPVSYGALTQLYCATAPFAADANGKFFIPWARLCEPNKAALDPQVGERLWTWLEKETNKY